MLNLLIHVSSIRIVHYNTEELLVHETFAISDDVWMAHCFQDSNLIQSVLFLFLLHVSDVDDLHYEVLPVNN